MCIKKLNKEKRCHSQVLITKHFLKMTIVQLQILSSVRIFCFDEPQANTDEKNLLMHIKWQIRSIDMFYTYLYQSHCQSLLLFPYFHPVVLSNHWAVPSSVEIKATENMHILATWIKVNVSPHIHKFSVISIVNVNTVSVDVIVVCFEHKISKLGTDQSRLFL